MRPYQFDYEYFESRKSWISKLAMKFINWRDSRRLRKMLMKPSNGTFTVPRGTQSLRVSMAGGGGSGKGPGGSGAIVDLQYLMPQEPGYGGRAGAQDDTGK